MILLLKLILLTSIIVLAYKVSISKEMLLERLGIYVENKYNSGSKVFDLFQCPWCMPTIFSIAGFGAAFGLGLITEYSSRLLVYYPLCAFGSCLVCGFTWTTYTLIIFKKQYYDNAQKYYYNANKQVKTEAKQ